MGETKSKSGCGSFIVLVIVIAVIWKGCFSSDDNKPNPRIEGKKEVVLSFIPANNFGWYRCVIPEYKMTIGNIEIQKSLFYISIKNGMWTVFHSQIGTSFVGNGLFEYSKDANSNNGRISGTPRDDKGQESFYEIEYKKVGGNNFQFTLVGSSGQPNVILSKIDHEVTTESYLEDAGKTLFSK